MPENLSDMQLAFMAVLWELSEASASQVQRQLEAAGRKLAPTTVSTVLRRLESRGLIAHRRVGRNHLYRAVAQREDLQKDVLQRWSRLLYQGNTGAFLCHLVDSDEVRSSDLDLIKQMIEKKEQELASRSTQELPKPKQIEGN